MKPVQGTAMQQAEAQRLDAAVAVNLKELEYGE
jgi:hypothetical protein